MVLEKIYNSPFIVMASSIDCSSACSGSGEDNTFATKSQKKKKANYKGDRKVCDCQ